MLQPPPTSERIATLQVNDQICVLSFGDWSHVQEARRVLRRMGAPLGGADRSEAVLAAAHVIFVHEALVIGEQSFGVSTPEQKCVGWPEQKYISDAGRKAPNWGPFLRASGLGRIHRGVSTGAA